MLPYYAALVAGIVLGVAGQIALKMGAEGSQTIALQFRHPATIIGFAIYVAAAVLYMISLKKIPLSLANPSVSVSYVAVALAAHFMWNEPFGLAQIGALVLIGGGIVLLYQ
jgi:multidrug transporter EmrE-like cation transporter